MAIPWVEMVSSLIRASSAQHPFRAFSELNRKAAAGVSTGEAATPDVDTSSDDSTVVPPGAPDPDSPGYKDMVSKLEARNAHVMEHEAAHLAAAGAYAKGGATYTYQIGPDGKPYAIGGQVNVDLNAVPGNPRATIVKMRAIQAAASAPDDPSGQDKGRGDRATRRAKSRGARKQFNGSQRCATLPVKAKRGGQFRQRDRLRGGLIPARKTAMGAD